MTKTAPMFRFKSASDALRRAKLLAVVGLAGMLLANAARAEDSLFAQIGGEPKLRATVDTLVEVMLKDDRINFAFANTDLAKFKKLLYDQLCELTDGPCTYRGRSMFEAHKKLDATNAQFNALAEDLYIAFETQGVPYRVQNKVMALLAPMQTDVVK
jgi:hemoglobin